MSSRNSSIWAGSEHRRCSRASYTVDSQINILRTIINHNYVTSRVEGRPPPEIFRWTHPSTTNRSTQQSLCLQFWPAAAWPENFYSGSNTWTAVQAHRANISQQLCFRKEGDRPAWQETSVSRGAGRASSKGEGTCIGWKINEGGDLMER